MNISTVTENGQTIAIVKSDVCVLDSVQSALDLLATVQYETGAHAMVVDKAAVDEAFFSLRTRLAGEILQKFINYHMKFAIVGDFSGYTSKSLADFIWESNRGKDIFFVDTQEKAVAMLAEAMS